MGAGRGDDVAAPGVVAGMRQVARGAQIAEGPHRVQPADTGDLHAEPVHEPGSGGRDRDVETGAVLVEIEGMAAQRADLAKVVQRGAGLLHDEGDVGTFAADAQRVAGGPGPVAVGGEPHAAAPDRLPDLAQGLDVGLDRATAQLDLQAGIAFGAFLGGDAGRLVRFGNADRIIGGDAVGQRAAQQLGDADPEALAPEVVRGDVDGGLGIVVAEKKAVHPVVQRDGQGRGPDQPRRHFPQRRQRAAGMGLRVGRADWAGFAPAGGAVLGHQLHQRGGQRPDRAAGDPVGAVLHRQLVLIEVDLGDARNAAGTRERRGRQGRGIAVGGGTDQCGGHQYS